MKHEDTDNRPPAPEEIQPIIEKAKQLSDLISGHEATKKYNLCRDRIRNDRKAQELYTKLVAMGRELSEKIDRGETAGGVALAEHELLQRELSENTLVKDYILSQKEYLELLRQVIDRIKNPGGNPAPSA